MIESMQLITIRFSRYCAITLLLISVFALSSCVGSRYSNKRKGESVQMRIIEDPNYLKLHELPEQQIPTLAMRAASARGAIGAGQIVSLAVMGVNKLIEMDRSQFSAAYGQSLNDLYFYDQVSDAGHFDPTGLQFRGFELSRKVKIRKNDTTALSAIFEIDPTNKFEILNSSVFRLRIKNLHMVYAKAKASDTRWYVPWTWGNRKIDDKMNMDLEIRFYTSYVTREGNLFDNALIGRFNLSLRDMPLNPDAKGYKEYYDKLEGKQLGGYSFLIPRSCGYALDSDKELMQIYNQGNYRIEVSVKETGKEKLIKTKLAENSTQIIEEGSGQLIKLLDKK